MQLRELEETCTCHNETIVHREKWAQPLMSVHYKLGSLWINAQYKSPLNFDALWKYFCPAYSSHVAIFAGDPHGNLLRESWWSPGLMLGTPHPNMCTLHLSILDVAMCFRGSSTFRLPPVPAVTFKTHYNWCETFFYPLLPLLPPPKKKRLSKLSATRHPRCHI